MKIERYFIDGSCECGMTNDVNYEQDDQGDWCKSVDVDRLEREREWISVKDRLPEKQCHCLVYAPKSFPKNCRLMIAEFYDDNNTFYSETGGEHALPDVTHWMLIPDEPSK